MKKQLLLVATLIFISFGAFAQNSDSSDLEGGIDLMSGDDNYYPILGDNSAFAYGNGNIYINTSYISSDFEALFAHFFNFGISETFSLTFGMANLDFYNPEILYLTPEFSFPLSDNITLGAEIIGIFPADGLDDFLVNPSFMLSFGSNDKHLSVGYGVGINSDGDFKAMVAIDGFYSVGGVRLNGRLPFTDAVALFSKNDYSSDDGQTYFVSKTGIEGRLKQVNLYAGIHHTIVDFGFGSDSSTQALLGLSYRIGG